MADSEMPSTSNGIKKNPKGKILKSGQKLMAYNSYLFHKSKGTTKTQAVALTAAAVGISERSMYKIVAEVDKTGQVSTAEKKRMREDLYSKLSEDEKQAIQYTVLSCFKRNEIPTLDKVFQAVNGNELISPMSRSTLFKVLKKLGFVWDKRAPITASVSTKPIISNLDFAIEAVARGFSTVEVEKYRNKELAQDKSNNIEIVSLQYKPPIPVKADDTSVEFFEDSPVKKLSKQSTKLRSPPVLSAEGKLLKGNFMGVYGPFGKPHKDNFLCPLCTLFRTKSVVALEDHLCEELQYNRFQCALCEFKTVSYDKINAHQLQHSDVSLHSITTKSLPPNPEIDGWILKVLVYQRRLIRHYRMQSGDYDEDQDDGLDDDQNDEIDEAEDGFVLEKNVNNFDTNQITTIGLGEGKNAQFGNKRKDSNTLKNQIEFVDVFSMVETLGCTATELFKVNSTTGNVPTEGNKKGKLS